MLTCRTNPIRMLISSIYPLMKKKTCSTRKHSDKFYQTIIVVLCCFIVVLSCFYNWKRFSKGKEKNSFVITLAGEDHRLPKIMKLFSQFAQIDLIPFYGFHGNLHFGQNQSENRSRLTSGQRGLRETMKMFFQMSIEKNFDEVLLFQDDAIPHLNFSSLYRNLHYRCVEADVLLLGASIWHRKRSRWPNGTCFDADKSTFGAYGLEVKRKAFQPILDWLNTVEQITFDHIYKYLQIDGLIVRVAHPPFLVIMDVSHKSLINNHRSSFQFNVQARAKIHGWNLQEYPVATINQSSIEH